MKLDMKRIDMIEEDQANTDDTVSQKHSVTEAVVFVPIEFSFRFPSFSFNFPLSKGLN